MSSDDIADPGHGHSPAAWTAVIIMVIAIAAGTLFFWLDMAVLVWASAGLAVVGLIVGIVMAKVGYGVGGSKVKTAEHK